MTSQHQQQEFESKKNLKAGMYTALVCGVIVAVCLISFALPPIPPPPVDEGIEVNLGNSDVGSGTDQPFEPGPPAPTNQTAYIPPAPVTAKDDAVKDIETDDKDVDAPEIKKPPVVKKEATRVPEKEVVKTKPVSNPKPDVPPTPPAPKPKILMPKGSSGSGTGGNEADSYKKGTGEGTGNGQGDQGRPGGNPDSKNYTGGGTGTSGVRIANGLSGRSITRVFKYQDDFNENATVAVDVRIDKNGNVISAGYQLRGSTTSESFYKDKAIEIVKKSKFNAAPGGPDEQTGTVLVNFRVRG